MSALAVLPLLAGNARLTALGLEETNFATREDWQGFGIKLLRWDSSWNWIKGDWWNAGERFADRRESRVEGQKPGRDPALDARHSTLDYRLVDQSISRLIHLDDTTRATLCTLGWICRRVPFSIRIEKLSWSHHREVAPIEDGKEQVRLLREAARNEWSVMDLRQAIRGKRDPEEAPVVSFVLPRWKNEFLREVAQEDIREWTPERRAATKAELLPIVEFWKRL